MKNRKFRHKLLEQRKTHRVRIKIHFRSLKNPNSQPLSYCLFQIQSHTHLSVYVYTHAHTQPILCHITSLLWLRQYSEPAVENSEARGATQWSSSSAGCRVSVSTTSGSSQLPVTPVPGTPIPPSSFYSRCTHEVHMQTRRHTLIYTNLKQN